MRSVVGGRLFGIRSQIDLAIDREVHPVEKDLHPNRKVIQMIANLKGEALRATNWIASQSSERLGMQAMRIAIAIIFLWIGALKFVPYEADSITPFVANNPVMSLFYKHPDQYKEHLTREGQLVPAEREWQEKNNTYLFSRGLGTVELIIGFLTLIGLFSPRLGLAGATLSFLTPIVTLSFLVTTPEAWVPNLGDAQFGFPYLSGAGRLVVKDVALLAGSWLVVVDCVRDFLRHRAETTPRFTAPVPNGSPARISRN